MARSLPINLTKPDFHYSEESLLMEKAHKFILFEGAALPDRAKKISICKGTASRSAQRFFLILLLIYGSSCTQPQLIENSQLNESRIHDTVSRVSYASGLRVNRPLSVKLVNRNELKDILKESSTANQPDVWAARQAGYRIMGFISGEWQDAYENVGLLSRSATGLYVSKKQTLYVVRELPRSEKGGIYLNSLGDISDEITLAHEIVHALQHQHHPEVFEQDATTWIPQADASIALQAAIEGDANLWAAQSMGLLGRARDPEEVIEFSRDSKFAPLSDAPILTRERAMFPYTYGYGFAFHEGREGLTHLPASTEQVIHIKKKGRAAFLAIDLSDAASTLVKIGCRVLFQDTMGELMLSLWLRSFDSTTHERTWDGWDGDRWLAVECEHSPELVWLISWDTEQDAQEFVMALSVITEDWQRRANLKSSLVVEQYGREVVVVSGGLRGQIDDLTQLSKKARVKTRGELAAHFSRATTTK